MTARPQPWGLDEVTEEDLDFIDDGDDEESDWRQALRSLTGYDPRKFNDEELGEVAVSGRLMIDQEEEISAYVAKKEDAQQLQILKQQALIETDEDDDDEDDDDEGDDDGES